MRIEQAPEERIEQHPSWIAINPVIGCPYNCGYCFLGPDNLRPKLPEELRDPAEIVEDLLNSQYYDEAIPVAIGTVTDMFATPKNKEYVRSFLETWENARLKNALVFITKGEIPDDIAQKMGEMQANDSSIVVFLSISGLDNEIEKGVNHKKLFGNIDRLDQYGVPVVHYWRPLMPQNSTPEAMDRVHSLVAGKTTSSFVGGMRLTEKMKEQIPFWPDILELHTESLDSVWAKEGFERISDLRAKKPGHPIYEAVSCTMANATKTPEHNGVYGTEICLRSNCSATQREICAARTPVSAEKVSQSLARLGYTGLFSVDIDNRTIDLKEPVGSDKMTNLIHSTGMKVEAPYISEGNYPWGNRHTRERVYISNKESKNPKQLLGLSLAKLQKIQNEGKKIAEQTTELNPVVAIRSLIPACQGLQISTLRAEHIVEEYIGPEIIDEDQIRKITSKWQTIYTSELMLGIFNTLSSLDIEIDQPFVNEVTAYTPPPEGWKSDLSDFVDLLVEAVNDIKPQTVRRLLADLAGCVIYGHKEANLGSISLSIGQLATKLEGIQSAYDDNRRRKP